MSQTTRLARLKAKNSVSLPTEPIIQRTQMRGDPINPLPLSVVNHLTPIPYTYYLDPEEHPPGELTIYWPFRSIPPIYYYDTDHDRYYMKEHKTSRFVFDVTDHYLWDKVRTSGTLTENKMNPPRFYEMRYIVRTIPPGSEEYDRLQDTHYATWYSDADRPQPTETCEQKQLNIVEDPRR